MKEEEEEREEGKCEKRNKRKIMSSIARHGSEEWLTACVGIDAQSSREVAVGRRRMGRRRRM
eukprot:3660747-Rhodomonas_salina.1